MRTENARPFQTDEEYRQFEEAWHAFRTAQQQPTEEPGVEEPEPVSPATTNSRILVTQSMERLTLRDVPDEFEEYQKWRFAASANIVAAGEDPILTMKWVLKIEKKDMTKERLITPDTSPLKRLDVRLSCVLLNCLKSPKNSRFAIQIQLKAEAFNGRQSLWILDKGMSQEGSRLALTASREMDNIECIDVKDLDEILTRFMMLKNRIQDWSHVMGFDRLRRILSKVKDVRVNMVMHAVGMRPPTEELFTEVVLCLRQISVDHKFDILMEGKAKKGRRGDQAAVAQAVIAVAKAGGTPQQMVNAAAMAVKGKGDGKEKKGRGGGYGNGGKGPPGGGTKKPAFTGQCHHCERYGHKKDQCWWRDIPKEQVPAAIAAAKAGKKGGKGADGAWALTQPAALGKGQPTVLAAQPLVPGLASSSNYNPHGPLSTSTALVPQPAAAAATDPLSQAFLQYLLRGASTTSIECENPLEGIRPAAESVELCVDSGADLDTDNEGISRESFQRALHAFSSVVWLVDCGASDHISGSPLKTTDAWAKAAAEPMATANGIRSPDAVGTAETPLGDMDGTRYFPGSPNCLSVGRLSAEEYGLWWPPARMGGQPMLLYPNDEFKPIPVHNRVPYLAMPGVAQEEMDHVKKALESFFRKSVEDFMKEVAAEKSVNPTP